MLNRTNAVSWVAGSSLFKKVQRIKAIDLPCCSRPAPGEFVAGLVAVAMMKELQSRDGRRDGSVTDALTFA